MTEDPDLIKDTLIWQDVGRQQQRMNDKNKVQTGIGAQRNKMRPCDMSKQPGVELLQNGTGFGINRNRNLNY